MKLATTGALILTSVISLTLTSPAIAWKLDCNVDDFTDERSCRMTSVEAGNLAMVGFADNNVDYALVLGDMETLYSDSVTIRVDRNDAHELDEIANGVLSNNRGFVLLGLSPDVFTNLANEFSEGQTLNVRLSPFRGAQQVLTWDLSDFQTVWEEFQREAN